MLAIGLSDQALLVVSGELSNWGYLHLDNLLVAQENVYESKMAHKH